MRNLTWVTVAVALLVCGSAWAQEEKEYKPIATGGGIEVYAKMDFDKGENPFKAEASGAADLTDGPDGAVSGRALHVKRAKEGGYFGARTDKLAIKGSKGLNIAFLVRSKGMDAVAMNIYDAIKKDNTTPASPAKVDDQWRVVVYAVEDFHHNDAPPQRKVPANVQYDNMFFHGPEIKGESGEYWIDKFIIYRGVDTQAPDAPANLKAVEKNGTVELTWDEPADNAFPAVYSIYRKAAAGKWEKVGESIPPRFADLAPNIGEFAYCVTAADYDNNNSKASPSVSVKVANPAKVKMPAPTPQVTDRQAYAENVKAIHAKGAGKVRHDVWLFQGDSITAADAYTFTLIGWLDRGDDVRRGTGMMRTDFGKNTIGKDLDNANPEFAVIMWGTNNSKAEAAIAPAMKDLEAIIDACAAKGTVPIIATIPPQGFDKAKQDGPTRYNEAVVKTCREKKTPVSYGFQEMMQHELKEMLGDGTHLKSGGAFDGNDAAGKALRATVDQIFWVLRDVSAEMK